MAKLSPLLQAVYRGNFNEVKKLLEQRIPLSDTDPQGRSALTNAVIDGKKEIADILLQSAADPNAVDKQGWTALHFAAQEGRVELAQMLVDRGAKVDSQDAYGNTPLMKATFNSRGKGEMILFLRRNGADVNLKNKSGVSPSELAKTIANFNVAQFFQG